MAKYHTVKAEAVCRRRVLEMFPDICPAELRLLVSRHSFDVEAVVSFLLDQQAMGNPYAKKPKPGELKRKAENDGARLGYGVTGVENHAGDRASVRAPDDVATKVGAESAKHTKFTGRLKADQRRKLCAVIQNDFPNRSEEDILRLLNKNKDRLVVTYRDLCQPLENQAAAAETTPTTAPPRLHQDLSPDFLDQALYNDLIAARNLLRNSIQYPPAMLNQQMLNGQAPRDEMINDPTQADAMPTPHADTMLECQCCFDETPVEQIVCCNAEDCHWFCTGCARRQAETQVGLGKYELNCMSMDQCHGGFSVSQRNKFLDPKLSKALDRAEQMAMIRMAGLENLTHCPFCDFAAECDPVDVDKEFRCQNPECRTTSCRLCEQESHVPLSCEEVAKNKGDTGKKHIEEAMSAAMIRRCNSCKVPFVKEVGCNKMTCPQQGCENIQCYVCSESCDYSHFDDYRRGGKPGNCPLFDNVEDRHYEEVVKAGQAAKNKVLAETPNIDLKQLDVAAPEKSQVDSDEDPHPVAFGAMPAELRGINQARPIEQRGNALFIEPGEFVPAMWGARAAFFQEVVAEQQAAGVHQAGRALFDMVMPAIRGGMFANPPQGHERQDPAQPVPAPAEQPQATRAQARANILAGLRQRRQEALARFNNRGMQQPEPVPRPAIGQPNPGHGQDQPEEPFPQPLFPAPQPVFPIPQEQEESHPRPLVDHGQQPYQFRPWYAQQPPWL